MDKISHWIEKLLTDSGLSPELAIYLRLISMLVCLILIAVAAYWITRNVAIKGLYRAFKQSSFKWDDVL